MRLRSPIHWFGGKGNMIRKLLRFVPPHKIYVEVFGGGASLLFAKDPSSVEVYNDIDSELVNFFRVLRDKDKFKEFYRKVCLTPYSREEFYYCKDTLDAYEDEVERAYRWYVVVRQSFSGNLNSPSWSYSTTTSRRSMAGTCSTWLSTIDMLPQIHQRIMRVQIEHDDFRKILQRYDTPDTFFYLDPPYVEETRKSGRYNYELILKDHEEMVELLLNLKGKVLLSGYRHSIYDRLNGNKWAFHDIQTACHAVGKTKKIGILGEGSAMKMQPRVETLWRNYEYSNLL